MKRLFDLPDLMNCSFKRLYRQFHDHLLRMRNDKSRAFAMHRSNSSLLTNNNKRKMLFPSLTLYTVLLL